MGPNETKKAKANAKRDLSSLRPSKPADAVETKPGTLPAPGGIAGLNGADQAALRAPRTPGLNLEEPGAEAPPTGGSLAPEPEAELDPFLEVLQSASLLAELPPIGRVRHDGDGDIDAQRLDMLEHYYGADEDATVAKRRRSEDGFFLYRENAGLIAQDIVNALAANHTDLNGVTIGRLSPDDVDLVLKHGDHMAAIVDEADEDPDTGEIDLRELEGGGGTASVYSIARALNRILARVGGRARIVPLRGDGEREAYVSVGITDALSLAKGCLLELEGVEEVMDFGGW